MLKFDPKNCTKNQFLKTSGKKALIKEIKSNYPYLEQNLILDEIIPKKDNVTVIKTKNCIEIVKVGAPILFFKFDNSPWLPHLKLAHKYPNMIITQTIDDGAIRHIIEGANVMCPGLVKTGSALIDCPINTPVAIIGVNKQHCLAIGVMAMSYQDIISMNKGIAINVYHVIGDSLNNFQFD